MSYQTLPHLVLSAPQGFRYELSVRTVNRGRLRSLWGQGDTVRDDGSDVARKLPIYRITCLSQMGNTGPELSPIAWYRAAVTVSYSLSSILTCLSVGSFLSLVPDSSL